MDLPEKRHANLLVIDFFGSENGFTLMLRGLRFGLRFLPR